MLSVRKIITAVFDFRAERPAVVEVEFVIIPEPEEMLVGDVLSLGQGRLDVGGERGQNGNDKGAKVLHIMLLSL